jgi:flagellar hook-length control protein FliK
MAGAHGGSAADTASNADVSRLRQAATAGFSPAAAAAGGATAADANSGLNLLGTQGDPGLGAVPGTGAGKRWLPSGSVQAQAPWKSTVASAGAAQDAAAKLVSARGALSDASAQPLTVLAQTASAPALISALAESDQGLSGRRRGTAPSESTRLDTPNPAGMSGATITPTAGGVATSGASASGQVLEQAVAEQVKYWISNDVHNAQLKFDGLGPQSVQVNISLSGNQAQVVFQSDQAQTRELLSNAMAQLEQMLRGEGLTLTAAWVGSSGQQGQNGSSAQQAQPVPQRAPATTTLSVEAASAPARTAVSTNRAVDLFV